MGLGLRVRSPVIHQIDQNASKSIQLCELSSLGDVFLFAEYGSSKKSERIFFFEKKVGRIFGTVLYGGDFIIHYTH